MTDYALEYADGRVTEITADNDTDATRAALDRFENGAVACDQWDVNGFNDADESCERLLIWESEDDSIDDGGAKAVAELTVVRR